jgi:hypothetical protein
MSALCSLVAATAGFSAGSTFAECTRTLRVAGMHDAAELLMARYEQIRAIATDNAAELASAHAALAAADIIEATQRKTTLPTSWPFPTTAPEALL